MTFFRDLLSSARIKYFTVYFNSNGGGTVAPITVRAGYTCSNPGAPYYEHYSFNGWYLNGIPFDFNTPILQDITLVAQWTYVPYSHVMAGTGNMYMWRYQSGRLRRYYGVTATFPQPFAQVPTYVYIRHPASGGAGAISCAPYSIGGRSGGYLTTTGFDHRVTVLELGISALYEDYNGTIINYEVTGVY